MSPFESLLDDLAALRDRRQIEANARAARHAAEAQRNRRMTQQPSRRLAKSAPLPDRKPDWDGLAARQDKIAAEMEQSRAQQQKNAIREHLSVLQQAAKAGRLSSFEAAKYDVYRGQALALGLEA